LLHLVAVLRRWAEAGWSGLAVFAWSLLQGSVLLAPPDALLAPLGVANPRKIFALAGWAVAGSTLGGFLAFWIGAAAFDAVGAPLLGLLGVEQREFAQTRALFQRHGLLLIVAGAFGPAKLLCVAAGAFGVAFAPFAAAHLTGRLLRFSIVAALLRFAGQRTVVWIERRIGRPIATLR
jgi:membrane protein YqaA with SNARE-associated domain